MAIDPGLQLEAIDGLLAAELFGRPIDHENTVLIGVTDLSSAIGKDADL